MKIPVSVLILFLLFLPIQFYGQDWSILQPYLSTDEKKMMEKVLEQLSEAGKLTQDANTYFQQTVALQQNYEMDEQSRQKELKKSEGKAMESQQKADKIYTNAYSDFYKILIGNYSKSKGLNTLLAEKYHNMADSLRAKAMELRERAKKDENSYTKATKLQDAEAHDNAAVDNMIIAIQYANEETISAQDDELQTLGDDSEYIMASEPLGNDYSTPQANSQTQQNEAKVNEESLSRYQNYLNDPTNPDPIMVNREGVHGDVDPETSAASAMYLNFISGGKYTDDQDNHDANSAITDKIDTSNSAIISENSLTNTTNSGSDISNASNLSGNNKFTGNSNFELSNSETDYAVNTTGRVYYNVQIAASRIPITRGQLWAIYKGDLAIEVVVEDNWFKYRISGFVNFEEANKVALETQVLDAFVMARMNGQLIELPDARKYTDIKGNKKSSSPYYFIQIAASKLRLSDDEINALCPKGEGREIIEQGWFKYQIFAGLSYEEAQRLKTNLNCKSFIVGYINGLRVK